MDPELQFDWVAKRCTRLLGQVVKKPWKRGVEKLKAMPPTWYEDYSSRKRRRRQDADRPESQAPRPNTRTGTLKALALFGGDDNGYILGVPWGKGSRRSGSTNALWRRVRWLIDVGHSLNGNDRLFIYEHDDRDLEWKDPATYLNKGDLIVLHRGHGGYYVLPNATHKSLTGMASDSARCGEQAENSDEDTQVCVECGKPDWDEDKNIMLLCDMCDAGWHVRCLEDPPPEGHDFLHEDWFCPSCIIDSQESRAENMVDLATSSDDDS